MSSALEQKATAAVTPGDEVPDWFRQLLALARKPESAARRDFLDAVEQLWRNTDTAKLMEALNAGDVQGVLDAIPFDQLKDALEELEHRLDPLREGAFALEHERAAPGTPTPAHTVRLSRTIDHSEIVTALTHVSPTVVEGIRRRAAQRITAVTDQTRAGVRQLVETAYQEGTHPRRILKQITAEVGLTPRLQAAVDRYRQALEAEGLAPDRVDRLVGRKAKQLLKYRADLIARTETMQAMNDGQRAAWASLVERGILDSTRMEREWNAILPDDRTCPICAALDGARAPIGGSYGSVGGVGPPQHPACRCTENLVPVDSAPRIALG